MSGIPSKFVIMDAAWGENNKFLFCPDSESIEWFATEEKARNAAEEHIRSGCAMIAILEVKTLLIPRPIEFDEVEIPA